MLSKQNIIQKEVRCAKERYVRCIFGHHTLFPAAGCSGRKQINNSHQHHPVSNNSSMNCNIDAVTSLIRDIPKLIVPRSFQVTTVAGAERLDPSQTPPPLTLSSNKPFLVVEFTNRQNARVSACNVHHYEMWFAGQNWLFLPTSITHVSLALCTSHFIHGYLFTPVESLAPYAYTVLSPAGIHTCTDSSTQRCTKLSASFLDSPRWLAGNPKNMHSVAPRISPRG